MLGSRFAMEVLYSLAAGSVKTLPALRRDAPILTRWC